MYATIGLSGWSGVWVTFEFVSVVLFLVGVAFVLWVVTYMAHVVLVKLYELIQ